MKKSTQVLLFILLFGLGQLSLAKDWHLSIAGGGGQANDPVESGVVNDPDLSVDSVLHFVLNHHESNADNARLYTEIFLGTNTLSTTINDGTLGYIANIDAFHAQIGGVYEWASYEYLRPYFAMTLGFSHYSPALADAEIFASGTAAIGAKIKITNFLGLRFEARTLATLLDSSSSIFCAADDCAITLDGTTWNQHHFTAGVTFSF